MLGDVGETLLHETAHPEPVTLPRLFPRARRIRCLGALGPPPFNGIARGLGQAVRRNALSMKEAVDFLFELTNNDPSEKGLTTALGGMAAAFRGGDITSKELFQLARLMSDSLSPWRYALYGMLETIWTSECTAGRVLVGAHPATVTKGTAKSGETTFLSRTMGTVTSTATAAFMLLALEDGLTRRGVYCPEDWVQPDRFYQALERLGTLKDELVITLYSTRGLASPSLRVLVDEGNPVQSHKIWVRVKGEIEPFSIFAPPGQSSINAARTEKRWEGNTIVLCMCSDAARMDPGDHSAVQTELRRFIPDLEVVDTVFHNWVTDEFSKGAWMMHRPRTFTGAGLELRKTHGNIRFAGSDLSATAPGSIEGALASGAIVARDLSKKLKKRHW